MDVDMRIVDSGTDLRIDVADLQLAVSGLDAGLFVF